MDSVILDFENKVQEIERYLNFIWLIDNLSTIPNLATLPNISINDEEGNSIYELHNILTNDSFRIEANLNKTLKGTVLLLLYNLVEGTITATLNEYFATFNNQNLSYSSCNVSIQKIWLNYKHRLFQTNQTKNVNYIYQTIKDIEDEIISIPSQTVDNVIKDNYDAYALVVKDNEISGNLDARRIRTICEKFGLPIISEPCDAMLIVKNRRNSLAHGNETFKEVGHSFTINDLFDKKIETVKYLYLFLTKVKDFLDNNGVLAQ